MSDRNKDHIYIREAAQLLNRRMGTLRKWENDGVLPAQLLPQRGDRGWRYWTPQQIEQIKDWLRDTQRYTGTALENYNPTDKELDKAIEAMRTPHRKNRRMEEIA